MEYVFDIRQQGVPSHPRDMYKIVRKDVAHVKFSFYAIKANALAVILN